MEVSAGPGAPGLNRGTVTNGEHDWSRAAVARRAPTISFHCPDVGFGDGGGGGTLRCAPKALAPLEVDPWRT
jgi:hypothetical protein